MDVEPVHLDGTTLEGGGQLLRVALALSSIFRTPIRVSRIRGKRGPKSAPGKDGGLKPAHLAAAQWLAHATDAATVGMELRSTELTFRPASQTSQNMSLVEGIDEPAQVWKQIFEGAVLARRETHIHMSSPGSIALILQAILPCLLLSSSSVPLWVTITGGTNVSNSPSIDYVTEVFFPLLESKLAISHVETSLNRRGWSTGRREIGSVTFKFPPLHHSSGLPPFQLLNRGKVSGVRVTLLGHGASLRQTVKSKLTQMLEYSFPAAEIHFVVEEDTGDIKKFYVLLVAQTEQGFRLGSDCLHVWKDSKKTGRTVNKPTSPGKDQVHALVVKMMEDFMTQINRGGCVDEWMQDQLGSVSPTLLEAKFLTTECHIGFCPRNRPLIEEETPKPCPP